MFLRRIIIYCAAIVRSWQRAVYCFGNNDVRATANNIAASNVACERLWINETAPGLP